MNIELIERAWNDRELLKSQEVKQEIESIIADLDCGRVRVAEKKEGKWIVNQAIKKAIVLYFPLCGVEHFESGDLKFWDKIPTKQNYEELKVRCVPPAVARYGSFLAEGCVMMPSFVNIGAYVDSGTMVDTWATVGSCAQIGKNVHLAGGVGIGGVLEPVSANPVIVEDNCFIGSRCIVVEGAIIAQGAVLGANTVITQSTKIIDVSQAESVEYRGYVPENSVVIPGSYTKHFPAGDYNVNCALIIGKRKESTDKKTSLNEALRDFNVAV